MTNTPGKFRIKKHENKQKQPEPVSGDNFSIRLHSLQECHVVINDQHVNEKVNNRKTNFISLFDQSVKLIRTNCMTGIEFLFLIP